MTPWIRVYPTSRLTAAGIGSNCTANNKNKHNSLCYRFFYFSEFLSKRRMLNVHPDSSSQLLVCSHLISPIYWTCLFVLLIGNISPGCGATGELVLLLLLLSCSLFFINHTLHSKLRQFPRCESQIQNTKAHFCFHLNPTFVFFPACLQMEQI